jgi:hypothetical protein
MKKWKIVTIVVACLIVIGGGLYTYVYAMTPRYIVIQKDRDISFGTQDTSHFIISPAKIEVTNLPKGKTLIIPVKVINNGETMDFHITEEAPSKFDEGYIDATKFDDYLFTQSDRSIIINKGETKIIKFTVTREAKTIETKQEKGFKIAQIPDSSHSVTLARAYIFEILIPN